MGILLYLPLNPNEKSRFHGVCESGFLGRLSSYIMRNYSAIKYCWLSRCYARTYKYIKKHNLL